MPRMKGDKEHNHFCKVSWGSRNQDEYGEGEWRKSARGKAKAFRY
jgi:hypothetical protein